jgi:Domain of unknown function (DUF5671)
MVDELQAFVREALAHGKSRSEIAAALERAGWSRPETATALSGFAEIDFPFPVPMPRASVSARDAFLYLVLFSALYVSAYHVGSLAFDLINLALPDKAMDWSYGQYTRMGMRWSVASLMVGFPVFMFMTWLVGRKSAQQAAEDRSKVRRWLTYLTLFAAACALIGDVTTLVYNMLGGELTLRFVLKIVTVAIIAGCVFGYYLPDLQSDESGRKPSAALRRPLTVLAPAAVVAVALAGSVVIGSPGLSRRARLDERRLGDLRTISQIVQLYWTKHGRMPDSLEDAARAPEVVTSIPRDPATSLPYEYVVSGPKAFQLCATFDAASDSDGLVFWSHGPGLACFDLEPDVSR